MANLMISSIVLSDRSISCDDGPLQFVNRRNAYSALHHSTREEALDRCRLRIHLHVCTDQSCVVDAHIPVLVPHADVLGEAQPRFYLGCSIIVPSVCKELPQCNFEGVTIADDAEPSVDEEHLLESTDLR